MNQKRTPKRYGNAKWKTTRFTFHNSSRIEQIMMQWTQKDWNKAAILGIAVILFNFAFKETRTRVILAIVGAFWVLFCLFHVIRLLTGLALGVVMSVFAFLEATTVISSPKPDTFSIIVFFIIFACGIYCTASFSKKLVLGPLKETYKKMFPSKTDNISEANVQSKADQHSVHEIMASIDEIITNIEVANQAAGSNPGHSNINTGQMIRDEENWRRECLSLSPVEYELQKIDGMEGHAFEEWCADLLRRKGFRSVKVTPGSGDQGVDVTAEKDGLKYAIQCKRYSSDLGNTPIQEVVAGKVFYGCQVGAVMTNRYFTSGAKELAHVNGILLWDRDVIASMLKAGNP